MTNFPASDKFPCEMGRYDGVKIIPMWPENQTRVPYSQWRRAEDEAGKWMSFYNIKANEAVDERRAKIAAQEVDREIILAMTRELDKLVTAAMDSSGNPKAPDRKALMAARAMLPAWCANSLVVTKTSGQ